MNALPKPVKGNLLVSEPFLNDPFFRKSVILVVENNPEGSLGFVLNKPVGYLAHELLQDFPESDHAVYAGGPVQTNSLYFVHSLPQLAPGSVEVSKGIYYGGDFDEVKKLISLGLVKPHQIRFFAGYSGWDEGQLDYELREQSWLVYDQPAALLKLDPEALWGQLLRENRSEMAIWANIPEDPSLN